MMDMSCPDVAAPLRLCWNTSWWLQTTPRDGERVRVFPFYLIGNVNKGKSGK